MRTAILVVGLIGSILALGVGACSGACMSGLGEAAGKGGEGAKMGTAMVLWAVLELILGLAGSIVAFRSLGKGVKSNTGAILLGLAAACSITNTFTFLTAGLLHITATVLAFIAKPTPQASAPS